ncbi:ATP-binding cassette domain-containing protein [Paenibacillus aurantius]|uniref:ATP-binding cassette domain-containing protein n=1 Tax=Paenibacillus aurantius TaxID=2918900 RepID=A0AA96RE16_9BACL|nr:ATP-binding cassette domain-containing protein [Paenibacillus aurantius]WNQ10392.1 ATP-binding cassette domain-containing protein [Paenibacillus aurantius]
MNIRLEQVVKTFQSEGGAYTALKGIDLEIGAGEFVAVIGKSGSGKSTLINMITGIDRPTSGKVMVAGQDVHALKRSRMAVWRGKNLGIIFQFFQLIPTLSLVENVMLPMDFCGTYPSRDRKRRALELLDRVGMAEQAGKMPSAVSGGQQQRVAIARALANDPPILVADEPTGSLDSKTAESVFGLFRTLADSGKTVVMVTHDNDLAQKVRRTVVVADGEIVSESVLQAFPRLDIDQLSQLQPLLGRREYPPGAVIIREGDEGEEAFIITRGEVEVSVRGADGRETLVNRLGAGQYFGEIALIRQVRRTATVRAAGTEPVELAVLGRSALRDILGQSDPTREDMDRLIRQRMEELALHGLRGRHA